MDYSVALTFRDNVVHRIKCGEDLKVAQDNLKSISSALGSGTYEFKNAEGELIYVANMETFMFAFIEETKGDKE
jgi:hypothetical protein